MPTIEMTNTQVHQIVDPKTSSGATRRADKALAENTFAKFRDEDGDTVSLNPANISSIYPAPGDPVSKGPVVKTEDDADAEE